MITRTSNPAQGIRATESDWRRLMAGDKTKASHFIPIKNCHQLLVSRGRCIAPEMVRNDAKLCDVACFVKSSSSPKMGLCHDSQYIRKPNQVHKKECSLSLHVVLGTFPEERVADVDEPHQGVGITG